MSNIYRRTGSDVGTIVNNSEEDVNNNGSFFLGYEHPFLYVI